MILVFYSDQSEIISVSAMLVNCSQLLKCMICKLVGIWPNSYQILKILLSNNIDKFGRSFEFLHFPNSIFKQCCFQFFYSKYKIRDSAKIWHVWILAYLVMVSTTNIIYIILRQLSNSDKVIFLLSWLKLKTFLLIWYTTKKNTKKHVRLLEEANILLRNFVAHPTIFP